MLIVTLGPGDSVMIGDAIEVSLEQVRTEKVIVGVEAPKSLPAYRIDGVERLNEPASPAWTPAPGGAWSLRRRRRSFS